MARRGPPGGPGPAGMAVVDKPAGWTSHDVVAKARGLLGTRKIGHAGTLDPDATGVLVLGTATATLDASGEVTGTWDMSGVGLADVRAAAARLTGDVLQVPPMVSAKQVGGRRLHDLARSGVEVEREPVAVRISRFVVGEPVAPGVFPISVSCSSGTYVRALAADLGAALGGGAHLQHLRRTAVGPFGVDEAVPLEALTAECLLPPVEALRGRPRVVVGDDVAALVRHGRVFDDDMLRVTGDGPWAVVDREGTLLAVYERHRGATVKPAVVLA
jgi:tRNA pseudouridine55 synthase